MGRLDLTDVIRLSIEHGFAFAPRIRQGFVVPFYITQPVPLSAPISLPTPIVFHSSSSPSPPGHTVRFADRSCTRTWLFGPNYASGKLSRASFRPRPTVQHLQRHNRASAQVELSLSLSPPHTMSRFHPTSLIEPQNHPQDLLDFLELDAQDRCVTGEFVF